MKNKKLTLIGYVIFFFVVALVMTISFFTFAIVNEKSGGNVTIIAITMLIVIIVLSLLCTLADILRRKIMVDKPVQKILTATDRMSEGDFSVRVIPTHAYESYDEYDLIMENLNRLAGELEKSEILKTDFISNVSHEIKTPLSSIKNYATLLKRDGVDEETKNKYLAVILSSTERLSNLVSNVLKLNKLENQELVIDTERFKLDGLLSECVLSYEQVIEDKNITLNCDIDEVEINSSKGYLEIAFNNLISNAVKFTSNGGEISVSLKKQANKAIITVSDTGVGISKEVGERIFDKFYQIDGSHAQEGNGLGLALVKKVIDLLGGEISVTSEVGVGSSFTISVKGVING